MLLSSIAEPPHGPNGRSEARNERCDRHDEFPETAHRPSSFLNRSSSSIAAIPDPIRSTAPTALNTIASRFVIERLYDPRLCFGWIPCPLGVTGSRAGFRSQCLRTCRFESDRGYNFPTIITEEVN